MLHYLPYIELGPQRASGRVMCSETVCSCCAYLSSFIPQNLSSRPRRSILSLKLDMTYHTPKRVLPRGNNGLLSEIEQPQLKRPRSDDPFANSARLESLERPPYESSIPQIPRHPTEQLPGRQILPLPQGPPLAHTRETRGFC